MEDVQSNKLKMKELEDNLLYRLTSTKVIIISAHLDQREELMLQPLRRIYPLSSISIDNRDINFDIGFNFWTIKDISLMFHSHVHSFGLYVWPQKFCRYYKFTFYLG